KHKDPLKPKHPILAFLVYVNERRAAFREENKNVLEFLIVKKFHNKDARKTLMEKTVCRTSNSTITALISV
ncbi:hypothetical protein HID58_069392, partial [Brassica napus]